MINLSVLDKKYFPEKTSWFTSVFPVNIPRITYHINLSMQSVNRFVLPRNLYNRKIKNPYGQIG